jgi:hypothetical protein
MGRQGEVRTLEKGPFGVLGSNGDGIGRAADSDVGPVDRQECVQGIGESG